MNTPSENIVNTFKGKRVLFLENDNILPYEVEAFKNILEENGIEHTILYCLDSEYSLEDIVTAINQHDAIVFMTQWVYEISKKLFEYVASLTDKKIIVQVYISEPTWFYSSQHGTIHDVFIYTIVKDFEDTESFYKLTEKPYWDYENNFDK